MLLAFDEGTIGPEITLDPAEVLDPVAVVVAVPFRVADTIAELEEPDEAEVDVVADPRSVDLLDIIALLLCGFFLAHAGSTGGVSEDIADSDELESTCGCGTMLFPRQSLGNV